jgi:hypothetical protein
VKTRKSCQRSMGAPFTSSELSDFDADGDACQDGV